MTATTATVGDIPVSGAIPGKESVVNIKNKLADINWPAVLAKAGLVTVGLTVLASPFMAWGVAGLVIASFGWTVGWLAQLLLAFLAWGPMIGALSFISRQLVAILVGQALKSA